MNNITKETTLKFLHVSLTNFESANFLLSHEFDNHMPFFFFFIKQLTDYWIFHTYDIFRTNISFL